MTMVMPQLQVKAISQGTFLKSQEVIQKCIILKYSVKLPTSTMQVLCILRHNSQKRKMNFSLKIVNILKSLTLLLFALFFNSLVLLIFSSIFLLQLIDFSQVQMLQKPATHTHCETSSHKGDAIFYYLGDILKFSSASLSLVHKQ